MRSERLTILVSRDEKRRLAALAKARQLSVGELVRDALRRATADRTATPVPSPEQLNALEEAASGALAALQRADAALNRAEAELAKSKAHFDSKAGEVREPGETPRTLLRRALARIEVSSR